MPDRSALLAVSLGLSSAVAWGGADFCGGVATRHVPVFRVVITSQLIGTALMAALALAGREPWPVGGTLAWCMAAGLFGAIGLLALYRALATGSMGLAAPISGVLSAAVPVAVAMAIDTMPSARQAAGFVVAGVSVWLVSATRERGRLAHVALAVCAGLGFGLFIAMIGRVGTSAVFASIVAARVGSLALLIAVASATRQPWRPQRARFPLVALAGIGDASGNAFLVGASGIGRPDVAAVLSSLYAGVTVLLACVVLRERLSRAQGIGLAAAVAAIVLITSG